MAENNFQLIKFLAATTVILCHSIPVAWGKMAFPPFVNALGVPIYDIAVDVFFVVSGYLVVGSLVRRPNLWSFAEARLRRLLPALCVSVWGSLLLIALFYTKLPFWDFVKHPQSWKFAIFNAFPLLASPELTLPGAFWQNPLAGVVNPSLWTLPWEVRMYIALAGVFVVANRWKWLGMGKVLVLVYCFSSIIGWWFHSQKTELHPLILLLFRFSSPFFGGASLWIWRDKVRWSWAWALGFLVFCLSAIWSLNIFFAVYLIALPYLVVFLALVPAGPIRWFNRLGDYSYGIYIFGFPVQQILIWHLGGMSVWLTMMLSMLGALLLAIPSWHLVEKRFMMPRIERRRV